MAVERKPQIFEERLVRRWRGARTHTALVFLNAVQIAWVACSCAYLINPPSDRFLLFYLFLPIFCVCLLIRQSSIAAMHCEEAPDRRVG